MPPDQVLLYFPTTTTTITYWSLITYIVLIQTKYLELDLRLTKSDTDK